MDTAKYIGQYIDGGKSGESLERLSSYFNVTIFEDSPIESRQMTVKETAIYLKDKRSSENLKNSSINVPVQYVLAPLNHYMSVVGIDWINKDKFNYQVSLKFYLSITSTFYNLYNMRQYINGIVDYIMNRMPYKEYFLPKYIEDVNNIRNQFNNVS